MSGSCGNPVCNWPDRDIAAVHAIALKTGAIDGRIKALKYDGQIGWARIFGRLVLGWLETNRLPTDYDLIVANPTHATRSPRHTELILVSAAAEDLLEVWPFDRGTPPVLTKQTVTTASAAGNWHQKKAAADELWFAVNVTRPASVAGARVLVIDDVTTTLLQLNVIAGILKRAGATYVEGLVIARAF